MPHPIVKRPDPNPYTFRRQLVYLLRLAWPIVSEIDVHWKQKVVNLTTFFITGSTVSCNDNLRCYTSDKKVVKLRILCFQRHHGECGTSCPLEISTDIKELRSSSFLYPTLQRSWKGGILVSRRPSVCPSVRPSVDKTVSALSLPQ